MGLINYHGVAFGSPDATKRVVNPLPKIKDGYVTSRSNKANKDDKGYFVKLKANVKYALAIKNRIVCVHNTLPNIVSETDTQVTYDNASVMYGEGWYNNFTAPMQPTNDCYFCCLDGERVYVWDDVLPYTSMAESDGGYKYWTNINGVGLKPSTEFTWDFDSMGNPLGYLNTFDFSEPDYASRMTIRDSGVVRDIRDSAFNVCFIGDSITVATTNAGYRNFARNIPYKLGCGWDKIAVSGSCVTNGYGVAWANGKTGLEGLLGESNKLQNTATDVLKKPSVFVIEIGTNDYGNNAPLGDVEAEDTNLTTFAGCYRALLERIHELYPTTGIICVVPFDREKTDENETGATLVDYCRVIHELVAIIPNTFILDLHDNYIIDYQNYRKAFVDYVHINKYAHAVVSNHLYNLILEVVTVCGAVYSPKDS